MTLYDDRPTRIRALSVPMTKAQHEVVKVMLYGFAQTISLNLADNLRAAGFTVDTLRDGRSYISGVEA